MSLNVLQCKIPDLTEQKLQNSINKKFKDDQFKKTDMTKRVDRLRRIMGWQDEVTKEWIADSPASVGMGQNIVWNRVRNTMNKLGLLNVNPGNIKANNVYRFLRNVERHGKGYIDEFLATNEFEQKLLEVDRKLLDIGKRFGLNEHQQGLMKTLGIEIGWQPFLGDYNGITVNGLKYLVSEQQKYVKLLQSFGMGDETIDQVVKLTKEPVEVFHETLLLARKAGITVNDLQKTGMGYFPHQYSKDYLTRMKWRVDEQGDVLFGDGTSMSHTRAFTKARESNVYIVEDEVVLDFLLTKSVGKNRNVYEEIGERIGRNIKGVSDLFDNDNAIYDAVANVLPDSALQDLVQGGLLSKIPVTSDKLFTKLKEAYALPYDNVNELMSVDYTKALQLYKKQLEAQAVDSNVTYSFVQASLKEGWGIPESTILANREAYRGWQSLKEVIPESILERYNIYADDAVLPKVLETTYVHPRVANIYKAELTLQSSPFQMSMMGQGLQWLKKWNTTMWLSTSQFVGRQFVSNFSQLFASGGNTLFLVEDLMRRTLGWSQGKNMTSILDNTKKIFTLEGKQLTERELYTKLVSTGYINDYTQAAIEASPTKYVPKQSMLNTMKRTGRQLKATWDMYPGHFGKMGEQAASYVDELVNGQLGSPFRFMNVELENLSKFALAKTIFGRNKWIGVASGNAENLTIKNLDDFVNYSSRYFFWYDQPILQGAGGDFINAVVPFMNYRTQNMSGTLRQIIHNPSKFAAYVEGYAALNRPMEEEDFPSGGVPDYVWSQMPVFFKMGKETTGLADDAFFYFPLSSIIQQYGAIGDVKEWQQLLLGSDPNQLPHEAAPFEKSDSVIQRIVNNESYLWAKFGKALLTGQDPETGYDIDSYGARQTTLLGVQVSPWTKYTLEMLFPPLERLDRWNPNEIFGQAAYYDQYTRQYTESKPSWTGAERVSLDQNDKPVKWGNIVSELIGIKGNFINVAYNMGMTHSDIKSTLYDGRRVLSKIKTNYSQATTSESRETLLAQYRLTSEYLVQLQIEFQKVDNWIKQHGFTTKQGLKYLKQQGLKTENLPDISNEEKEKIRKQVEGDSNIPWK